MLGYVLPVKSELKLREYEIYSGYYCGICKYIGRRYGQLPRMALSYDAAFLALILSSVRSEPDQPLQEHCILHHIKHKTVVRNRDIEYAGDVMLILAWFKLLDDAADEGRLYAKATTLLLKHHYEDLKRKHPSLCREVESQLAQLTKEEKSNCSSIDRVAEPFARIMAAIFREGTNESHRRSFQDIGYHLGKWIYLMDATDDIEENLDTGTYNPLLYRFQYDPTAETAAQFRKRIDEDLRFNLFQYLAVIGDSYERLDIAKNSGIIDNVIYFGLNRKTEDVLLRRSPAPRGLFDRRSAGDKHKEQQTH